MAYVSPSVLRWARQRSGLSVTALANRANLKQNKLAAWEDGSEKPTIRQAQHIAGALHVPFGYFFLSEPPDDSLPLHDFRTVPAAPSTKPSAVLVDLVNDVLFKHSWYRDFLEEEQRPPLPFVARFGPTDPVDKVAEHIQRTIGNLPETRQESNSWDEFLRRFCRRLESLGILVMRSGVVGGNPHRKLDVREFRGFAIADKIAPLIFVNGRDARAAQAFTVAHELAHIWIGASGISNESLTVLNPDVEIERFCNGVAAEVLVPTGEFKATWSRADLDTNLNACTRRFRVSSLVILRRAFDLRAISEKEFRERYAHEERRFLDQEEEQEGGNFFPTLLARNSARLTAAVLESLGDGRTLHREAAQLLNVKVPTLQKVAEFIEASAV